MLLEALVAILIFSLGVLGMVGLSARAIQAGTDSEFRSEAARMTSLLASRIALNVDRQDMVNSLTSFAHQTSTDASDTRQCTFSGTASNNSVVTDWVANTVLASGKGLPGTAATNIQVAFASASFNRVTITLCWRAPSDLEFHRYQLVSYIN